MTKVLIETKNALRKKIGECDLCKSRKFKFAYSESLKDTVLVNCRSCGRRLYVGGDDING